MMLGLDEGTASVRVNRYEQGVHSPDAQTLIVLANELGVPPGFLLTEDDTLAAVILAFSMLPAVEKKTVLNGLLKRLGPTKAEKVKAHLAEPPPPRVSKTATKKATAAKAPRKAK